MAAWRPRRLEWLLLLFAAYVLSRQLLLPGYIGLANNGDFPKVVGRFALAPPNGWNDNFIFFAPDYQFAPGNYWVSEVLSSEIVVAGGPILLAKAVSASSFNIRWVGAGNAALWMLAFYLAVLFLRPFGRTAQALAGVAMIVIGADVVYAAYFNSFYSDSPAILGALLGFAAGALLARDEKSSGLVFAVFTLGALLFVTSKSQHGLYAFAPAAFAIWTGVRAKRLRMASWAVAVLLMAGCVFDLAITPKTYATQALFNVLFFKLAPQSHAPMRDLREIGVPESDARYIGTHAFMPGSPVNDREWAADFLRRTGYAALVKFYVRHPRWAWLFLTEDLTQQAHQLRPNYSNFQRSDGHPPGDLTRRFAVWSDLRSALYQLWPWHVVVWFALFTCVAVWAARRASQSRRLAALAIGAVMLAVFEFCFASLADGAETYRHLLIFHLLTDVTVMMAVVWGLNVARSVILRSSLWLDLDS